MASKLKVTIKDDKISPTATDLGTQAKDKQAIDLPENGTEGNVVNCAQGGSSTNPSGGTAPTFPSIMTSYSVHIAQLLERLANIEKIHLDALEKASSMSTAILAQRQEIQALERALSTVRQEEAKKAMAEVNEEMTVKYEETELKCIELRFDKAALESVNEKLEKHNKQLQDVVTRFKNLYGDLDEAEEADDDA